MSVKERTVCDNTNVNASQLANFSGNWNNTDNAGVFQLNVNQTASNTNANYSARQMFPYFVKNIFDYFGAPDRASWHKIELLNMM